MLPSCVHVHFQRGAGITTSEDHARADIDKARGTRCRPFTDLPHWEFGVDERLSRSSLKTASRVGIRGAPSDSVRTGGIRPDGFMSKDSVRSHTRNGRNQTLVAFAAHGTGISCRSMLPVRQSRMEFKPKFNPN